MDKTTSITLIVSEKLGETEPPSRRKESKEKLIVEMIEKQLNRAVRIEWANS